MLDGVPEVGRAMNVVWKRQRKQQPQLLKATTRIMIASIRVTKVNAHYRMF